MLSGRPSEPDGGDGPAWSRKRASYAARSTGPIAGPTDVVPYAELHCHSNFSFLDGVSAPEELVRQAVRLGLTGLALTDHDGFYGVVRMAEAADEHGLPTMYGAELSLGLARPQNGVADPEGSHLLVLARGETGYHALAEALTTAHLTGGEKGRPVYDLDTLTESLAGRVVVLTGCRKGAVRQALTRSDVTAATRELTALTERFGRDNVFAEVYDHGYPLDAAANDAVAAVASAGGVGVVATGNVHYAHPRDRRLAHAVAAVRARRGLDEMDGWLPASGAAFLRSGAEMAARFARFPGAVARTADLAADLAFPLRKARPRLPRQAVPDGHTSMSWLRELVRRGCATHYPDAGTDVRARLERELTVIERLDFPGYFLIVHDIVAFARSRGILCQGRGSAANSAVCYVLGITAVDPVKFDLPFERFLSTTRDEEPDIDVDFDSDRREEVIQWVYAKYGRRNAAQVCNVVSYRPRSAVRDMAKALGYSSGQQDAWSKSVDVWGGPVADHDIPGPVLELANELLRAPRQLGIHSGGIVLTDRPIGEVCPIEPARMVDRTVLQWDKDDCAWMGLVKFDLLGLGMLGAVQHTLDVARERVGEAWTLASIPKEEPGVYDQLCRADAIGVFQVESRAQLGTLPRLRPRCFYDLVTEIALIRPGPIQGGAVHPYIRRRTGAEPITYPHPLLEPVLERTLGVPLFQEQLMQIAMTVGGCSGDDADLLRRAMGSKRGIERIGRLREQLFAGMAANGVTGAAARDIYQRIEAFANFGFAESHSISFALIVYASTWLRLHYPGAFLCGLLRAQPMGFYSPQSLVADARRHGVVTRRPCILHSGVHPDLELLPESEQGAPGRGGCLERDQPEVGPFDPDEPFDHAVHRRDGRFAVRLGLASVTGIGVELAERLTAERAAGGPYRDLADLVRRVEPTGVQLEALATAGAFDVFGLSRRQALWSAGIVAGAGPGTIAGTSLPGPPPTLPNMASAEATMADLWATTISPESHPMQYLRDRLAARGVLRAGDLAGAEPDRRVLVAGVVTHRQRPATASGVTFLNLEDETGMINVICTIGVWNRHRSVGRNASAMIVRGTLECRDGAVNVLADRLERLALTFRTTSRDFR
ncbi:error-prone DNA polymerase [Skermania piniformis]|uniref:Error-prone DNA polymerase n=2 Tax=Skermania pinensis TaxID=39122 RepID=A0ABX8SDZ1_9ACTN|nr:error-prone DNA polymerase [Skermania piniformis]QXQ15656.1 error-prone DNA polymerase [Skermania piniformis]